jgi:hypothetical protein
LVVSFGHLDGAGDGVDPPATQTGLWFTAMTAFNGK